MCHERRFHHTGNASDIKYADLDQSTPYMRLTLRNIGQREEIFSGLISYLHANAMQATNQGVGSSNLSGRAIKSNSYPIAELPDCLILWQLSNIFQRRGVARGILRRYVALVGSAQMPTKAGQRAR
jgi:hypothetical protein